jgi:hypothetical protein
MTTRDEYVAKMESQLDDMNAQQDKPAAKSRVDRQEMQAGYNQEMADQQAPSSKVSARLDEVLTAGEEIWEDMFAEMEKIGDAYKHSYN